MEQYDLTIFWRIQGKVWWCCAMVNERLDIFSGDVRKGFNIAWTLTLPDTSCIAEQFKDIQEVISFILHCMTMYCCRRTSPSTSTTSGYKWNAFNNQRWTDPRRKKSQKGKTICVFTIANPMDDDQSVEEILCDLDKPRIAPYENTWRPHQNTVYRCNLKTRSEERIAIL